MNANEKKQLAIRVVNGEIVRIFINRHLYEVYTAATYVPFQLQAEDLTENTVICEPVKYGTIAYSDDDPNRYGITHGGSTYQEAVEISRQIADEIRNM